MAEDRWVAGGIFFNEFMGGLCCFFILFLYIKKYVLSFFLLFIQSSLFMIRLD
jgi:hypothetical protein